MIAFARIAEVLGPEAAAGNLVGIAPEDERDTVAAAVRDAFGAAHEPLALGARLTPRPSPVPRATARLGPDAALAAPTPGTATSPTPSTPTQGTVTPPTRP